MISEREGLVTLLGGDRRELHRMRSPIQEGKGGVAMELYI
jgi:hypothetical protein